MRKLDFAKISTNYSSNKLVSKKALFEEIGWDDLIKNASYDNTCAIRMSLALIKSGISLQGRIPIRKGSHKGKQIEPGQQRLSIQLRNRDLLGTPLTLKPADAGKKIGRSNGIISFMGVAGYLNGRGGHIDIISANKAGIYACGSDCYWGCEEIWFWHL